MAAMAAKDSQISAHLAVRPDWLASGARKRSSRACRSSTRTIT